MTTEELATGLLELFAKAIGCTPGEMGEEWRTFASAVAVIAKTPYQPRYDPEAIGVLVSSVVDLP